MFLRILMYAAVAYFVYMIVRFLWTGARRSRFKCADCRHCGKLFEDGVLCRFHGKETFKNETHIGNCIDHAPRR